MAGKHAQLSVELADRIVEYVKAGNYVYIACTAAGVHKSTYYQWLQTGHALIEAWDVDIDELLQTGDLPEGLTYNDLLRMYLAREVVKAEAEAEAYAVLIVRKHMPDQWTAAMTYLERRFPDRWRKRQTIENQQTGTSTALDEQALIQDPEAVRLLHEALEKVSKVRPVIEATSSDEPDASH